MVEKSGQAGAEAATDAAIDQLAQRLYWSFELDDPGDELVSWESLDDHQRGIYRAAVRRILQFKDLVEIALD